MRLTNRTRSFTLYHVLSLLFSIIIWLGMIYFLSLSYQWSSLWTNIKPEGIVLFASPKFWLMLLFGPTIAFIPEVSFSIFKIHKSPMDSQIMREMEHGYMEGVYVKGHTNFVQQVIDPGNIRGGREEEGSLIDEEDSISESLATEKYEEHNITQINRNPKLEFELLPGTLTWHEVVNDDKKEDIDHLNVLGQNSRHNSIGFQVVTTHVGVPTIDISVANPISQHGKISFGYYKGCYILFNSLRSSIQVIYLKGARPYFMLDFVHMVYMVS